MELRYLCFLVFASYTFNSCEKINFIEKDKLVPPHVMEDDSLPVIYANGLNLHSKTYGNLNNPMKVRHHIVAAYIMECKSANLSKTKLKYH